MKMCIDFYGSCEKSCTDVIVIILWTSISDPECAVGGCRGSAAGEERDPEHGSTSSATSRASVSGSEPHRDPAVRTARNRENTAGQSCGHGMFHDLPQVSRNFPPTLSGVTWGLFRCWFMKIKIDQCLLETDVFVCLLLFVVAASKVQSWSTCTWVKVRRTSEKVCVHSSTLLLFCVYQYQIIRLQTDDKLC